MYGHCTLDRIAVGGNAVAGAGAGAGARAGGADAGTPGGAACYCGIMSARLGFDAELHTRHGPDFPADALGEAGRGRIRFAGGAATAASPAPTTRFSIDIAPGGASRTIVLECMCDGVQPGPSAADGAIVSPLLGEVPAGMLAGVCASGLPVLVDVQGFVRRAAPGEAVRLEPTALDLSGAAAVKAGRGELECVSGGASGIDGMLAVQRAGAGRVVHTDGAHVMMLSGDRLYELDVPARGAVDTTGAGDILSAAFLCTLVREEDDLWALCFGAGAAQAALESGRAGIDKVPEGGKVESNASYFYNTVKFRGV